MMPSRLLATLARVRPDERGAAAGAFLTLFAFMAGHAMVETARDALFLASIPARQLPWVYLAIAVIALLLTQGQARTGERFRTTHELSGWMTVAAVVTLGLWLLIGWAGSWVFYVLYVWSGVLATLVVVRFWTLLAGLFTVTQAKRLFATIGTGSVVGAIVGSGVARILTEAFPAQHVLLAASLVFLCGSAAPRLLGPVGIDDATTRRSTDLTQVANIIWERPYLRRVAGMILAATITFTLVDFVFKSTAARLVPDESLGEFFSSVYLMLNLVSLVVQVGFVAWLFRRLGVSVALAIVPALLTGASILFAVGGGLALVVLLRGVDGSLRHSLYRTGTELLFVPLAGETRNRVKAFIDVAGQRGGQAVASLLILLGLTLTQRESAFAIVATISAGVWLYLALDLKSHYLNVFRETLSGEGATPTIALPLLDMASLESLLSALNDPDDVRVITALDMLVAQEKTRVVPALILYHPSPDVVVHALTVFEGSGRTDWLPIVERLLGHSDPGVRVAGLRAQSAVRPDRASLERALGDSAPQVRATALVGLVAGGWMRWESAQVEIDGMLTVARHDDDGEKAVLAVARAIRHQPAATFEPLLPALVDSRALSVRLEAVRAMGAIGSTQYVAHLIPMLAQRAIRHDARAALVSIGPTALVHLEAAISDSSLPHAVRRHVPTTIALFASTRAADLLVHHLHRETDGMIRFKILRALGNMRRRQPGLPLDRKRMRRATRQTLATAGRFMMWKQAVSRLSDPAGGQPLEEMLATLLHDKQQHAVERLFRLLNLESGNDDFWHIYRGLNSDQRVHRASSRELLEHLVFPPMREPLLRLIDNAYGEGEAKESVDDGLEYEAVLRELLGSGIESVSSVAARLIAAQRRFGLLTAVKDCEPLSVDHQDVLERVQFRLGGGDGGAGGVANGA